MAITEDLLMEVIFIVIQHPLNPLYPVVQNEFQFRPLDFTQNFLNASGKILWPGELLFCSCCLHVPKKPDVRRCHVRIVRRMRFRIIKFSA
jgi:hypothetical protein